MKYAKQFLICLLVLALPCMACAQEAAPQWTALGEGANEMSLVVVLTDSETRLYKVYSDETTLLEGLSALGLIETMQTEDGAVQLTVVDGITAGEGAYWFIAVMDEARQQFVPMTLPLTEAPFAQSYAFGLIVPEAAEP